MKLECFTKIVRTHVTTFVPRACGHDLVRDYVKRRSGSEDTGAQVGWIVTIQYS